MSASANSNADITDFNEADMTKTSYCFDKSTEENYCSNDKEFYGPHAKIRAQLDYNYHRNYTKERQHFQDKIIRLYSGSIIWDSNGYIGTRPTKPWCVFTAGAMGAGKGYTIKHLKEAGRFPLVSFVSVDPDEIRREFPEFLEYVNHDALKAGERTMKEAGYVAEILQLVALNSGKNVLVDGSLRNHAWYQYDFNQKRELYPEIKLAIIHVVAPRETVFARAEARAKVTGRVVPKDLIAKSLEQCLKSVNILKSYVDYFAEISNAPETKDVELVYPISSSWDDFSNNWKQVLESPESGTSLMRLSSLSINNRYKLLTSGFTRGSVFDISNHLENGLIPQDRTVTRKDSDAKM